MNPKNRRRLHAEDHSETELADGMVQQRVLLGFGGVKVITEPGRAFNLRHLFTRLRGLGFRWVVLGGERVVYYTQHGSGWSLPDVALAAQVNALDEGDFPARIDGQRITICYLAVSSSDEGAMTQAMIRAMPAS